MQRQAPLTNFMERYDWSQYPLRHYWNFGYHSHSIVKIMNALPRNISTALKRLVESLHCIAEDLSLSRQNICLELQSRCGQKDAAAEVRIVDSWDDELIYGLIQMDLDPELQTREQVEVNKRASYFWGLSKASLMDLFIQNQVPLQMTELDWVRAFSIYISRFFECSITQYLRFHLNHGMQSISTLVCMTTVKSFNKFGRISKASQSHLKPALPKPQTNAYRCR